jgi:NAD+ synthase
MIAHRGLPVPVAAPVQRLYEKATMTERIVTALAQLNPTVGAVAANLAKARQARAAAARAGADLIVFAELFLSGYPPEDLVLRPSFVARCRAAAEAIAADTGDGGPGVLIGTPWSQGGKCYNAVVLADGGRIEAIRFKHDLPNYGVFDEKRVFAAGPAPGPVVFRGVRLGVPICEDIWTEEVCECLLETGAELFIVPNGSPFERGKEDVRLNIAVARVTETGLPLIYLNQVGGQDELVFDGSSFGLNADRTLAFEMASFVEDMALVEWRRQAGGWAMLPGAVAAHEDAHAVIWRACVTGLKDYVDKNRFPGVVLGLSGGIDSAVVAAMAVDALGPDRVQCLMMPYKYTAQASLEDAAACAGLLKVGYEVVAIAEAVEGFGHVLAGLFAGLPPDVTEENIQARARGTVLMAVSNKFGSMVLTTGNKSEMSVGYATLYGDMNGGFNPVKDVYKTEIYALARYRNQRRPAGMKGPEGRVIPERIIARAPSAELRPDQTDQDSLPPYAVLDDILTGLVEAELSISELVARGHDRPTVERIQHMLYVAEYKRRQAAPGVKITARSYGRDRRYPITNAFREKDEEL